MHGRLARALVSLSVVVSPIAYAHEPKLTFLAERVDQASAMCEGELGRAPMFIPDAESILNEPHLLERLGEARVVLAGWVLEELNEAAEDEHLQSAVKVFKGSLMRALAKPEAERRVRIDNLSYVRELTDTGLDRTNSSTKLLALANHYAAEKPTLLSGDIFLVAKAQSLGLRAEIYDVANPLTDPNTRDLYPFTITDEQMRVFEAEGKLPKPDGLDIQPNQFVQFSSPDTPGGKSTVGRYIFERPKQIKGPVALVENRLELPLDQVGSEFIDTLRVKVNGELVPRIDLNPKNDGGWSYDGHGNVIFTGKRYLPVRDANFEVFIQQRPHRIEGLRTYKEMGVDGTEASFEQLMLMNLMTDPTIDCVIVVGRAGASKTYSAATAGLWAQKKFPKLKVLVTRVPAHVGARDPGAVPGGLKEKESVWILALLKNISQILKKEMKDLPNNWENVPFAYMRGLSLIDSLVIFDEAQNSTKDLMKTMVTRVGRNSRIFIMGDVTQTDKNENLRLSVSQNGLAAAVALYRMPILTAEEKSRFAVIHMRKSVRSDAAAITARIFEDSSAAQP